METEDSSLPDGSYIAVRIGDIQKQTIYDPKKVYCFPEARRFGKIDVYRRVGTCDLIWGTEEPEARSYKVIGSEGDTGTRLKVCISRPAVTGAAKFRTAQAVPPTAQAKDAGKGKEASPAAKRYLKENDVEAILTGALRALLKTMPEDAPSFLCNYITNYYAAKPSADATAPVLPSTTGPLAVEPGPALEVLRLKARNNIIHASTCGKLEDVFSGTLGAQKSQPSTNAKSAADLEKLRLNARDVMLKAHDAGDLEKALAAVKNIGENDAATKATGASGTNLDIESLRCKARSNLIRAQGEGKLDQALAEVTLSKSGPAAKMDIETLRVQARDVMVRAFDAGDLDKALAEVSSTKGNSSAKLDLDNLRFQARDVMLTAYATGDLDKALSEISLIKDSSPAKLDIDKLRLLARDVMLEAYATGDLDKALLETKIDAVSKGDIDNLRLQTRDVMLKAYAAGDLDKALAEVNLNQEQNDACMDIENLRIRAREVMLQACNEGDLDKALTESVSIKKETVDLDVETLRSKAREVMLQACNEGDLDKALSEVRSLQQGPAELGIQDLRLKAREVVVQAFIAGDLDKALAEVKQEFGQAYTGTQILLAKAEISGLWRITEHELTGGAEFVYEFTINADGQATGKARASHMDEWTTVVKGWLQGEQLSWSEFALADNAHLGEFSGTVAQGGTSLSGIGQSEGGGALQFDGTKDILASSQ